MMRKRMVFRLANIQQRPERFWLVMSPWEEPDVEGARIEAERLGDAVTLRIGLAETAFFAMRAAGRGKGRMRITGDLVGDGGVGDRAFGLIS